MKRNLDKIAKDNNLSRRTHSHSWDKDGYLTVTTSIASIADVPREDVFQHVFFAKKAETGMLIQTARDLATETFLALEAEEATMREPTTMEQPVAIDEAPDSGKPVAEEKPKRKRASRKKKPETETPEAGVFINKEVAAEDDGLGALDESEPEVFETYEKGNKIHGKCLSGLLIAAYGPEWQKDEKVKIIVRGLVAAIKDVVPVVNSKGEMLDTFPVFVAEYLKKAA